MFPITLHLNFPIGSSLAQMERLIGTHTFFNAAIFLKLKHVNLFLLTPKNINANLRHNGGLLTKFMNRSVPHGLKWLWLVQCFMSTADCAHRSHTLRGDTKGRSISSFSNLSYESCTEAIPWLCIYQACLQPLHAFDVTLFICMSPHHLPESPFKFTFKLGYTGLISAESVTVRNEASY